MPPGQRRYEVQLSSKSGPIDVFLIQDPVTNNTHTINNNHNNPTTVPNNSNKTSKNTAHHFHAAEMLKHFDIPMDAFAFE